MSVKLGQRAREFKDLEAALAQLLWTNCECSVGNPMDSHYWLATSLIPLESALYSIRSK